MSTHTLTRPGGRLAVDLHGETGPLVICAPGMGELRSSFRHLIALLRAAGFRVAALDLRGHGESDAQMRPIDDDAIAGDLLALADDLSPDAPVLLAGNSMSAGAAVIAAAREPDRVSGLALLGPFVRDGGGAGARLLLGLLLARPWGPGAWASYHRRLFPGAVPADHEQYLAAVQKALREPGRWAAFRAATRVRHGAAEAALAHVSAPTVVIMGEKDPDWPDPAAEAQWIAAQLGADTVLLPGVGHYPQAQAPAETAAAIIALHARTEGDRGTRRTER